MKHKNLALETLRKLLNDQIRITERTNIVQSRAFRKALEEAIAEYSNRAVTTIQVIEELLGIARRMREAERRGEVVKDDKLRLMARELSDTTKRKVMLDWTQRGAVQADI